MAKILKHKWHKKLLIAVAILTGFIFILAFSINLYWSPILARSVRSAVLGASDSLYKVDFSDAELHFLRGEVEIHNVTIQPDTTVYNQRKQDHIAPNNLVTLRLKRLVLTHVHPIRLYFRHVLDIGSVELKEPELTINYHLNHTKDTIINHHTFWQMLSKSLKSVHVNKISLSDVKFRYEDYSHAKPIISEVKELNLNITDLLIDSATQTDKSRFLYSKDVEAELNNYSGRSPNGLYNYSVKAVRLSTRESRLNIVGLDVSPVKADVFFQKTYHDRFKVHLDSLQLNRFDFLTYHKYRILNASLLKLSHGELTIFGNPKQSPKKSDRVKSFPHYALHQLNADITIDSILANHINIVYTEFNKKSNKTGTIAFDNSNGIITNISTNKDSLAKNNLCTAYIHSYVMNSGKIDVLFKLNLTDSNAAYSYKGSIGPMNLQKINQASMPLGLIKLNSGKLNQMNFDIQADRNGAHGRFSVAYNDLKVTVLKADTARDRLKHMTLASLYANIMVIRHNNPDTTGKPLRVVNINYHRPDSVAFFGGIWKTLFTGIKPSIGFDDKTQRDMQYRMTQMAANKQERKAKKLQRQLHRAERLHKREQKKILDEQTAKQP